MNEDERQRLAELAERLFRNESLEEAERAELRAALAAAPEARKEFLLRSELEAALGDAAEHGMLGPVVIKEEKPARLPATAARPRRFGSAMASLAAAAAIAIGLGAWWVAESTRINGGEGPSIAETETANAPAPETQTEPAPGPVSSLPDSPAIANASDAHPESMSAGLPKESTRDASGVPEPAPLVVETATLPGPPSANEVEPVVLGSVRAVENVSAEWENGSEVATGEHQLASGSLEFQLVNGVRVRVEGPTRFTLESAMELRLLTGRMSAEVIPVARGFRIEANDVTVIDYGTRFAVTANAKGDAAVHVYNGGVTAGTGREEDGEPLILDTGETVRLNLKTGVLESMRFGEDLFAAKPAWTGSIAWHSDGVEVLAKPPRHGDGRELPHGHPVIFRERSGLVLRRDVEVNLLPGVDTVSRANESRVVPRGRKISSYLLHGRGLGDHPRIEGEVRFDSPILGIIHETALLNGTDRTLGSRSTDYPAGQGERGAEGAAVEHSIAVSENRRTVQFSLHAPILDQFRILVAED